MSTLSSMTGFARVSGGYDGWQWQWEARSVNGRNLDMRVKLPPSYNYIEQDIKKILSKHFTRGNFQISLSLSKEDEDLHTHVNEPLFEQLVDIIKKKNGNNNYASLMLVEGVVTVSPAKQNDSEIEALHKELILNFKALVKNIQKSRFNEGKALSPLFEQAIGQFETLIKQAESAVANQAIGLRERLEVQIKSLGFDALSPERLAQEVALLVTKADVREELDRLKAHCSQAKNLLSQGSPIGRKLEFLSQELNREANTLCAKSADIELTRIGLEMKSVVEQFREQAANVE